MKSIGLSNGDFVDETVSSFHWLSGDVTVICKWKFQTLNTEKEPERSCWNRSQDRSQGPTTHRESWTAVIGQHWFGYCFNAARQRPIVWVSICLLIRGCWPWKIYIYMCMCIYVCVHIYVYIYMYLYVYTVYPGWHARGFVVLCFVVVVQSFIMNSHEVFILIHQGCVAGTGAIVRLPQCRSPAWWIWEDQSMYNHGRARRGRSRVRVSWDILCVYLGSFWVWTWPVRGGVILKRRLSVAGPIPGMIPEDICEF